MQKQVPETKLDNSPKRYDQQNHKESRSKKGKSAPIQAKQRPVEKGGLVLHMTAQSKIIFEQVVLGATDNQVKASLNMFAPTQYQVTFIKVGDLSPENTRFLEVMQTITKAGKTTHILVTGLGEPGREKAVIGAYRNVPEQEFGGNKVKMGTIDLLDMVKASRYSDGKIPLRMLLTHEIYENHTNQVDNKNEDDFPLDHEKSVQINEYVEGIKKLDILRDEDQKTLNFSYTKGEESVNQKVRYNANNNIIK